MSELLDRAMRYLRLEAPEAVCASVEDIVRSELSGLESEVSILREQANNFEDRWSASLKRESAAESANRAERALWSRLYGLLTGQGEDFQGCYSDADLEREVRAVAGKNDDGSGFSYRDAVKRICALEAALDQERAHAKEAIAGLNAQLVTLAAEKRQAEERIFILDKQVTQMETARDDARIEAATLEAQRDVAIRRADDCEDGWSKALERAEAAEAELGAALEVARVRGEALSHGATVIEHGDRLHKGDCPACVFRAAIALDPASPALAEYVAAREAVVQAAAALASRLGATGAVWDPAGAMTAAVRALDAARRALGLGLGLREETGGAK